MITIQHIPSKEAQEFLPLFRKPDPTHNEQMIAQALDATAEHIVVALVGGAIVGAAAYDVRKHDVRLWAVGSTRRGAGTELVSHVVTEAYRLGKPCTLYSDAESAAFYSKLGFALQHGVEMAIAP